jgi:hypothetical protein
MDYLNIWMGDDLNDSSCRNGEIGGTAAELQDILLDQVFNTDQLQKLAQKHGLENVSQMFYQTLPYVAEVNRGSGYYAFTHGNNNGVFVWDCKTGEQLGALQYQTLDQAVNFIKVYDQTNVLTGKTLAEFFGPMVRERIVTGGPVLGMER